MREIHMVDLKSQYQAIKSEVDRSVIDVMSSAQFIKGPKVSDFEHHLAEYLGVKHVISCANGTDALQIALMALDLNPGDEVIVPAFTYVATAEVIALLGLSPVMVDVDANSFNITADHIEGAITKRTKAIVPVHLFGQSADMEEIMLLAKKYGLKVIEDNAQAIGAEYTFKSNKVQKVGTIGDIGCTSFFPSKNLGCFGDGGAMMTDDEEMAKKLRTISNHGQAKKYHHSVIGVNSRLDAIQAVVLDIKLKRLNDYSQARQEVAQKYDEAFKSVEGIQIPKRLSNSTHVFHQYTLQIKEGRRDSLKDYLREHGIPSMVYYPIPLYSQIAFEQYYSGPKLENTEYLCDSVLSLPIHTEMENDVQHFILDKMIDYFE
jgi:dTDP-4-amino-4,6-dideoxygalactose transaminase